MKISVILPCWNEERTIYHAIKSVLCIADEILVFNDASNDNSLNEIQKAQIEFGFEKIIVFEGKIGVNPKVRNRLIEEANNKLIISMDADCCFIEDKKERFLKELELLKPGDLIKFRCIEIARNLSKTTNSILGQPDVTLCAMKQDGSVKFYADGEGFAKTNQTRLKFSNAYYAYHFKFNKPPERIAKRCVYREHVVTGKSVEELFQRNYGHVNLEENAEKWKDGIDLPDHLNFRIYRELVEYVKKKRWMED